MALSNAMLPGMVGLARPLLPVVDVALVLSVRVSSRGVAVVVCAVLSRRLVASPFFGCRLAFPSRLTSPRSPARIPRHPLFQPALRFLLLFWMVGRPSLAIFFVSRGALLADGA